MRSAGIILVVLLVAWAERAVADTVALGSSKDNTLYENTTGAVSNGAGQHFFAGRTSTGLLRRGLIAFDIASAIPAGSTITSVTLRLHMSRTMGPEVELDLYPVQSDWGEGTSAALGDEGQGAPATPGDATWIHTFYDQQFWGAASGDISTASSGSAAVSTVDYYLFDSTFNPVMVSDVQGWLDQPGTNFGWALKAADEFFPMSAKRFDTKENANPDFSPQLTINYTPPAQ